MKVIKASVAIAVDDNASVIDAMDAFLAKGDDTDFDALYILVKTDIDAPYEVSFPDPGIDDPEAEKKWEREASAHLRNELKLSGYHDISVRRQVIAWEMYGQIDMSAKDVVEAIMDGDFTIPTEPEALEKFEREFFIDFDADDMGYHIGANGIDWDLRFRTADEAYDYFVIHFDEVHHEY